MPTVLRSSPSLRDKLLPLHANSINNLRQPTAQLHVGSVAHIFTTASTTAATTDESAASPPAEPALKLSDACVAKISEICKSDSYLRVLVDGGGCSGFQYKFELDTKVNDDDVHFGPDGRVLIDSISLDYCAGATLDYSVELIKSGFRMVSNPKAEQGCSCGASFALKM